MGSEKHIQGRLLWQQTAKGPSSIRPIPTRIVGRRAPSGVSFSAQSPSSRKHSDELLARFSIFLHHMTTCSSLRILARRFFFVKVLLICLFN